MKTKKPSTRRKKKHCGAVTRRPRTHPFEAAKLTSLPIVAFGHPALREAYRVWWDPRFDLGDDFRTLGGRSLWTRVQSKAPGAKKLSFVVRVSKPSVIGGHVLMLRTLDPKPWRGRTTKTQDKPRFAKVRLVIDYPVTSPQTKVVTIDRRYPGEIFAFLHDFYREIYAEDEKRGGKPGPSGRYLKNRGFGPLVWGHDLGDLVLESVHYQALTKDPEGAEGVFRFGIGS